MNDSPSTRAIKPKNRKRLIKVAHFDKGVGPISVQELMSMRQEQWGDLRARITAKRQHDDADGYIARCMLCDNPVFIRAIPSRNGTFPGYAHFGGMDEWCPWSSETTLSPDQVRAIQYQGRQVSPTHDRLCATLKDLASLDERCVNVQVEKYLAPTETAHGRFPDVFVDWGDKKFVLELQLSRTFQTEIADRSYHYDREKIPLIWVLYGLNIEHQELPQSFVDVIREHRENAFVIDAESCQASRERQTLVLKCYERHETGFSPGRLVTIDDLTFPENGLPYFSDQITPPTLRLCQQRRKEVFLQMKDKPLLHMLDNEQEALFTLIAPEMRSNHKLQQLKLLAVVFAIVSHSAGKKLAFYGKETNLSWTINQFYNDETNHHLAFLIDRALRITGQIDAITTKCKAKHTSVLKENIMADDNSEYLMLKYFIPEIYDAIIFNFLKSYGAFPSWINSVD